jgi:CDP-glycerol glycerophosphotransferase
LRDTVLFQSWGGKQYSDSPRAVYEEMRRQGRDEPALWVRRDTSVQLPAGTPSVLFGSHEYFEALATARYVVANDSMPTFYEKRPASNYLQTWHGTPLKRIGFDIENAQFGNRNYLNEFAVEVTKWNQLVSPNPFSTEVFRRAFRFDGEVLETGYPRNDVFYAPDAEERRQRIREGLGLRPDQRVILWAPTWREDQRDARGRYTLPLPFDLSTWDRILQPDDVLLFRGHQLIQQTVGGMLRGLRQVRNVTLYPDIQELYLAADLLITDYSSVMFDFANTRRPMIFYTWDLDHYRDHLRGFYLEFEQTVPGPVVTDLERLRELLDDTPVDLAQTPAYQRFVDRFCGLEDGAASARVVSALFGR